MDRLNALSRRVPTAVVWGAGVLPLIWLVWQASVGGLGPDPVKVIEHQLGLWALQFLIASLCISPLRRMGLNLVRFRRALGVMAFLYAVLHFLAWVVLDMGLRWSEIIADLWKRPYIILGFVAFCALLPLAVTSTDRAMRRMGPQRWRQLHRLTYVAAAAAALHYVVLVKGWPTEPLVYAGVVAALLLMRLRPRAMGSRSTG